MRKKIKIILLEDIVHIGHKYEVFEVSLGYFRNYLLPKGLAKVATDIVLKQLSGKRKKVKEIKEKRVIANKQKAKEIEGSTYIFNVKAGPKGKVYGSVTTENVAEKVAEAGYKDVNINLTNPLKNLGEEQVWVDFGDDVRASVNIILQKEGISSKQNKKEKPKKEIEEKLKSKIEEEIEPKMKKKKKILNHK